VPEIEYILMFLEYVGMSVWSKYVCVAVENLSVILLFHRYVPEIEYVLMCVWSTLVWVYAENTYVLPLIL